MQEKKKIKKEKYLCFADFEFTTGEYGTKNEIISVGIVIMAPNGKCVEQFYSLVRPVMKRAVTKRTVDITGLCKEQLMSAPKFEVINKEIVELIKKYGIKEIFTWGTEDCRTYKLSYNLNRCKGRNIAARKMKDVQATISKGINRKLGLFYQAVGLQSAKELYGLKGKVKHNALSDALDLSKVYRCYIRRAALDHDIEYVQNRIYKEMLKKKLEEELKQKVTYETKEVDDAS